MQKLWPEEWRRYCEWEWGTPDEQQALKDEEFENANDLLRGSPGSADIRRIVLKKSRVVLLKPRWHFISFPCFS